MPKYYTKFLLCDTIKQQNKNSCLDRINIQHVVWQNLDEGRNLLRKSYYKQSKSWQVELVNTFKICAKTSSPFSIPEGRWVTWKKEKCNIKVGCIFGISITKNIMLLAILL